MNYKNGIDYMCVPTDPAVAEDDLLIHVSRKDILSRDPRDEAPHMRANSEAIARERLATLKDIPVEKIGEMYSFKRLEETAERKEFLFTYYRNNPENDNKKEKLSLFADSIQNGLEELRSIVGERLASGERCYAMKRNENGEYEQNGMYLIKSGRDITPIPLELPPMKKDTFEKVTSELSKMGAKFNKASKKWVVPRNMPKEKRSQIDVLLAEHDETKVYLDLPAVGRNTFASMTEWLKKNGASYDANKKSWYIFKHQNLDKYEKYLSGIKKPSVLANLNSKKEQTEKSSEAATKKKEKVL
ncbi:MAG: hypothetical protein E7300_03735 [Lachnospiraceae bacterium]|nr:hypothetical protein [Lachnospiraceae bacterium]